MSNNLNYKTAEQTEKVHYELEKAAIVLFNDDFRVQDNDALFNAVKKYEKIIPLFIYNENLYGRPMGLSARCFLHTLLPSFSKLLLEKLNLNLICLQGDEVKILNLIKSEIAVDAIYFNKGCSKNELLLQKKIEDSMQDIDIHISNSRVLFEPEMIKNGSNLNFLVFTPFAKECIKHFKDMKDVNFISPTKKTQPSIASIKKFETLSILENEEELNRAKEVEKLYDFNHESIENYYINFVKNSIESYSKSRNNCGEEATSKISHYLRFGVLGIKFCIHYALMFNPNQGNQFILELLWREFAYYTTFYYPNIATVEIKKEYKNFQWDNDSKQFEAWKNGKTGFDIVDAGMIELLKTGTMHNRVRMITASFLIKDLFIDWKMGEAWFWENLVDADPCINPFSWQWVFGSGLDAAPYFRIFNPELQAERFDEHKVYRKKWLNGSEENNKIVDHSEQRDKAMFRYKAIKS